MHGKLSIFALLITNGLTWGQNSNFSAHGEYFNEEYIACKVLNVLKDATRPQMTPGTKRLKLKNAELLNRKYVE